MPQQVLASAVALGLTAFARNYIGPRYFTFSYAAVAISGAMGLGPGVLATILCVLGVNYFFIKSPDAGPSELIALGIFLLVALLISGLASRLRRARLTAEAKHKERSILLGSSSSRRVSWTARRESWKSTHPSWSTLRPSTAQSSRRSASRWWCTIPTGAFSTSTSRRRACS